MKPMTAFLWIAILSLVAMPALGTEDIIQPRQSVAVSGNVVKLGDLFTGVGDKANVAVAYAPQPGKRAIFDSRWLTKTAKRHGLAWQAAGIHEYVVVERESQTIKREEIEDAILAALFDQGLAKDMKVELSNPMMRLHVPSDVKARIEIEDVTYDARTRRFDAGLVAPAGSPPAQRHRVTGRAYSVIAVPVLKRPVAPGETVDKRDIEIVKLRADQVQPDVIVDVENLLGKTAKRGLRAGQPALATDVSRPIMVAKGSLVTVTFKAPRMTLTTQGRAVDAGSVGDTIRVTNTQSSKTVEAVVTGAGQALVGNPATAAAIN
jgi:flagella basal body P-ring formation protein FlgA